MKIALIENFGSDFYGARLRYALFLKNKGHAVTAVVPDDGYADKIRQAGIDTIALKMDIRKRNLNNILGFVRELRRVFKAGDFDVIHLYRMQPNLVGSMVAYVSSSKRPIIVNHITGLGVAFTKTSFKYKVIQFVIKSAYNINNRFFRAKLIFQNDEDKFELGNKPSFAVVKGSAVNEECFHPSVEVNAQTRAELEQRIESKNSINLMFVSRLLKQKGLQYLVDAVVRFNHTSAKKANLVVVGWIDPNNPDSFTQRDIDEFEKNDQIVFLGKRSDVNELIAFSDVAILPTYYREGTPRFLLEAMAMAKPIVTTDMPGCNHLVESNNNGVLVRPKDTEDLVNALHLITVRNLEKMGAKSFEIYQQKFSESVVYNQLLNIYHSS